MILIIGGAYQGKKDYAFHLLYGAECKSNNENEKDHLDGETCELKDIYEAKIIYHFHFFIRRALEDNWDMKHLVESLFEKNPNIVIVSNEIGYGVVPMDPVDRRYREVTGRIMCSIAKVSREVHRVVCGIGTVIKHD